MNRSYPFVAAIAFAVATAIASAASPPPAAGESVLAEVLVTAQKRTEKVQDVPIAITVVGEEQIARQHIYSIADLARSAPALEMIQAFGGPGGGGQVRGIGTVSFAATAEAAVGIVVDGVSQGRVQGNTLYDMQRIEVLRGPQGTLFGLTTSAGVINMTTQAPKIGLFETNLHLDYSNSGTAGSEFGRRTLNGAVNVPINETQALRVAFQGDQTLDVVHNNLTGADSKLTAYSGRVRYLLNPAENFTLNLSADYTKDHGREGNTPAFTYVSVVPQFAGALAACGIVPSYDNNERCGNRQHEDGNEIYGASAQIDVSLGEQTFTSISAYRKSENGPTYNDFQGLASATPQIFSRGAVGEQRQISQELRILSPSDIRLEYVAGVFYADYHATTDSAPVQGNAVNVLNDGFFVGVQTPGPFISFIPPSRTLSDITNKSIAAFGETTFHATDALALITGLRYTHQKIESAGSGNLLTPAPIATFGETTENVLSGRVGLKYKFSPNLSTYATATKGYKGPQVTPAAQGNPASVLAAEKPTAYEIGVKGAVFDGRLGFDANVFDTKVKNFQGQRCGINASGVLFCPPDSIPSIKSRGLELGVFGSPLRGLTMTAGFIYDQAEYPSGYTGFNPNDLRPQIFTGPGAGQGTTNLGGLQLVNVPKTKFTLSGDYTHNIGTLVGFVSLDTVYKSEIRFGPSADPAFVYPSHWTHGARLGVRSENGNWSVGLFGRNLGKEREPIALFGGPQFIPPGAAPFAPNGQVFGVSQVFAASEMREVGLSVDVHF